MNHQPILRYEPYMVRIPGNMPFDRKLSTTPVAQKSISFSPADVETISTRLSRLLETEKPFLHKRYSIGQMAQQVNMPVYQLSAFINQQAKMNFNDFVNLLRICYCMEIIEEKEVGRLNIYGLAARCGFCNRNTFTNAFKKYIGCCPSQYKRKPDHHQPALKRLTSVGYFHFRQSQ